MHINLLNIVYKLKQITNPAFRFRRWSRKTYAAFISVGRFFTIGCLNKSVIERALLKQARLFLYAGYKRNEKEIPEEDTGKEEETFEVSWYPFWYISCLEAQSNENGRGKRLINNLDISNCGTQFSRDNSRWTVCRFYIYSLK